MASVIISGDTSGTVTLQAPAVVGGAPVLTLPTTSGTLITTATGQTLTNPNITGAVMSSMASSVITSGTAKAWNWNGSSTNTFLDFTDIPSWVKRITIMFVELSYTGTATDYTVQLGTGTTPTYITAASSYFGRAIQYNAASTTQNSIGFNVTSSFSATDTLVGTMVLDNFGSNTWIANSWVSAASNNAGAWSAGYLPGATLGGTLSAVRITFTLPAARFFDAGSVNIIYE